MAGTSMGMQKATLVGLRVAVRPQYIPGYEKNGQTVNPCLKVRACLNDKKNKTTYFDLRLWGKLADIGAKSLSIGKEFHADVRIDSYQGRVWRDKGKELVCNSDGTPVTVMKHSFVVEDLRFGGESEKFISEEIAKGKRPANWSDGGEGSKLWRDILKKRMAVNTTYERDGITYFGYAEVRPNGTMYGGTAAPAQNLQNQVANATNNTAVNTAFGNAATGANDNPF